MGEPSHHSNLHRRVTEFKSPSSKRDSQEVRRAKALEYQKKRRAERIESSRNIDLFAGLSLEPSKIPSDVPGEEDEEDDPVIPNEGLAQFAMMLSPAIPPDASAHPALPTSFGSTAAIHTKSKSRSKNKRAGQKAKSSGEASPTPPQPNRLANAIMYAELLEMNQDLLNWDLLPSGGIGIDDGIPKDLQTNWVAMAPVPQGKRCMAVAYQLLSGSRDEPRSKTQLHSRVKGTPFLTFPSPLPPDTILDCILDSSWQQNGILHVVDILRWRGSEFADAETEFRFWWRDARLSELGPSIIPPLLKSKPDGESSTQAPLPIFAYPTLFLPVPYYPPPLYYASFMQTIIPQARAGRQVTISVPLPRPKSPRRRYKEKMAALSEERVMEVDGSSNGDASLPSTAVEECTDEFGRSSRGVMEHSSLTHPTQIPRTRKEVVTLPSDGILLYVSQASYQPGESPLTCWIPSAYFSQITPNDKVGSLLTSGGPTPLDLFESLIRRRCSVAIADEDKPGDQFIPSLNGDTMDD